MDLGPAARRLGARAGGEVGPPGAGQAGRGRLDHRPPGRPARAVGADPAGPRAARRGGGAHLLLRPGRAGLGRPLAGAAGDRPGDPPAAAPQAAHPAHLGGLRQPAARRVGQPAPGPGGGGQAGHRAAGPGRGDLLLHRPVRGDRGAALAGRAGLAPGRSGGQVPGVPGPLRGPAARARRRHAARPGPPGGRVAAVPAGRPGPAPGAAPARLDRGPGGGRVRRPAPRLGGAGPGPLGGAGRRRRAGAAVRSGRRSSQAAGR